VPPTMASIFSTVANVVALRRSQEVLNRATSIQLSDRHAPTLPKSDLSAELRNDRPENASGSA
jgi:hypothetical protein